MEKDTILDKFQRTQMAKFVINNKEYCIYEGVNTVGRNRDAIVNVKHLNISQNHALLLVLDGRHFLSDLNSSNGTFYENCKVIPYKIYQLKDNTKIRLGDVSGTYFTKEYSISKPSLFELTQDVTQSFYGNTQILQKSASLDTETEDIHEAPTQEISFSQFKIPKRVKPLKEDIHQAVPTKMDIGKGSEIINLPEDDINNCQTQVICTPNISNECIIKEDTVEKNVSLNNSPKTSIVNINDATINILSKSKDNQESYNTINNAATQKVLITKNTGTDSPIDIESEVFDNCNEPPPFIENSDNYVEIHQLPELDKSLDIYEAVTQVIDIRPNKETSSKHTSNSKDVATDSKDNIVDKSDLTDTENVNKKQYGYALKISRERGADIKIASPNAEEATDCEDNVPGILTDQKENKNINYDENNDNSNDSMDFFKFDNRSTNRDSIPSSNISLNNINITKNRIQIDKLVIASDIENFEIQENDTTKTVTNNVSSTIDNQDADEGKDIKSNKADLSDDDETDIEQSDTVNINIKGRKKKPNQDRSQIKNDSDEVIIFKKKKICQLISDSDSETDEDFIVRRKGKSFGVISTQDFYMDENKSNETFKKCGTINTDTESTVQNSLKNSKQIKKQKATQESYFINDTDSETEVDTGKKLSEKSIQETQADLDETDCIPATQDVDKKYTEIVCKQTPSILHENNGSSEESFKLGLTELMMIPSQNVNTNKNYNKPDSQEPCCSKSLNKESSTLKVEVIRTNTQSDDTDAADYYAATQKICDKKNESCINNDYDESMDDLYIEPTQKIPYGKSEIKSVLNSNNKRDDTYLDKTNSTDIYSAATQNIFNKETGCDNDETVDDLYAQQTQKLFTQKSEQCFNPNYNTLKLSKNTNCTKHNDKEESIESLYIEQAQKVVIDDIYIQPTQAVKIFKDDDKKHNNNFNSGTGQNFSPNDNTKHNSNPKKTFSFKNKSCNLDGSLSTLVKGNHESPQMFYQREVMPSIDIDFTIEKDPTERPERPKNPLSNILENIDFPDAELQKDLSDQIVIKEQVLVTDHKKKQIGVHVFNIVGDNSLDVETISFQKLKSSENDLKEGEDYGITHFSAKHETDKNILETTKPSIKNMETINKTETKSQEHNGDLNAPKKSVRKRKLSTDSNKSCASDLSSGSHKRKSTLKKRVTEEKVIEMEIKGNTDIGQSSIANASKSGIQKRQDTTNTYSEKITKNKDPSSDIKLGSPPVEDINKTEVNVTIENSLNYTANEINQSVALLEAKKSKTKKSRQASEIEELQIKVPRNRKSMTISEIWEPPTSLDVRSLRRKTTNINNNVVPKRGRPRLQPHQEQSKNINPIEVSQLDTAIACNKSKGGKTRNRQNIKYVEENVLVKKFDKQTEENMNIVSKSKIDNIYPKRGRSIYKKKSEEKVIIEEAMNMDRIEETHKTPSRSKTNVAKSKKRQTIKNQPDTATISENSDTSGFSIESNMSTPKKQKLNLSESLLNTAERGLRRHKPKVVFTMLDSPQLESLIRQLGGSIVETIDSCTVLITEHVKRSQKLLSAVGQAVPICSPTWITDSKKATEFLDPWNYILVDSEAEAKWKFSLKESLKRSKTKKILDGYNFQVQVTNAADVLKGAIESCGGKCISKLPSKPSDHTYIISSQDHQSKYRRILKQHPNVRVIEAEAIFDGILRQELRFSKHYLT